MLDHLPEGTSDFLQDSSDETVSTQALRILQREMTAALLPPGSRREGMLDEYVNLKDLHPDIPELTELAGGKGANQRCEVFLPLVEDASGSGGGGGGGLASPLHDHHRVETADDR